MARTKKHHKKPVHHRRRRMGGIGAVKGSAMTAVYAVAGAAAAQLLTKVLPSTLDARISAAAPVAIGLFLPKLIKGDAGKGIATGMIAVGGLKLVQSFGVLNGIGAVSSNVNYSTPLIGATYNRSGLVDRSYSTPAIAGMDEIGC
jgi:hypothetical protein